MKIFAQRAYCKEGWNQNVRITIEAGKIVQIALNSSAKDGDIRVDTLMPALANVHSHSFQRAMAGMTEYRAKGRESFWTWRDLMYRFLHRLTPDHIAPIAAQTFMEMQKVGYASVGEFHYIHNQPDGARYANPAELSEQIMAAAKTAGIGLTHLPVLYSYGGVDGRALTGGQLRFANDLGAFSDLVSRCKTAAKDVHDDTIVGIAPHSLRGSSTADIAEILSMHKDGPVHIHIAEQVKEVEDIKAALGARPVEHLLDHAPVDARWCMIHATHLTEAETTAFAKSGAVAGLCPITEANLGDGIFNGPTFLQAGGAFGLGSDSNVNISLTEELRMLEYSQRLRDRERNVLVEGEGSTGKTLYLGAAKGGAQALGRTAGRIETGALADLVAINSQDPTLCALREDQLFDGLVFAAKDTVVTDLWSAGRHQVQAGRHTAEEKITTAYRAAISDLTSDI
ncbi:formimidoylglutamate deiminase [Aliiroseovarius lamellibrachiae]|uniref:formimidoylglutamate deiminase n=1 Tax=Aliiroseovarius lamellibrachiae TaxID=1924933 RepID=UPI001BDF812D|nr:formimidoylglutamate deiminase [Aliiroseovarius lamellibrachiae]MBT2132393.1 formimidoylglutamate deiminase [Aliiroseovarius lamellibrachiae]